MRLEAFLGSLVLAAQPVLAEGLDGRAVLFRVETLGEAGKVLLAGSDYVGRVGKGPEFGMVAEGNGILAVVPVTIDVAAFRIDFSYEDAAPAAFVEAPFNGYVLTFPVECTLLTGAAIDPATTTLPVTDANLTVEPQALRIDVAGLSHKPTDRIGVTLSVTDCPMS